ncbi:hypothetical protein V6N13_040889 [Hibiscus sabdariffa]
MEHIKQRCFDQILEVTNLEFSEFIKAMEALEERVRKCYQRPIDHCGKLLEMMVYDGCFVVMLINNMYPANRDDMFKLTCGDLGRDLDRFAHSALSSFQEGLQCSVNQFKKVTRKSDRSWKFIHSATELEDAGIGFLCHDQAKEKKNLFDITYITDTGVLSIPTLHVDDNTVRLLRNFMAYEQVIQTGEPTYVSDYVVFMDNLINTGKDVQLLCKSGIIDKWFGDDEAVAQMFNKLCDSIRFSRDLRFSDDFYYADTFVRVNKFCKRKWNKERVKRKWKKYNAMLKKDYFNSPWSGCSFAAATVLLLLTLLQTIYTVFSYYQQ